MDTIEIFLTNCLPVFSSNVYSAEGCEQWLRSMFSNLRIKVHCPSDRPMKEFWHLFKVSKMLDLGRDLKVEHSCTKELYRVYLSSYDWRKKREDFYLRYSNVCQRCEELCLPGQLCLHHLTYENVGDELPWEVVPVCHDCHEAIHRERFSVTINGVRCEMRASFSGDRRLVRLDGSAWTPVESGLLSGRIHISSKHEVELTSKASCAKAKNDVE